ncbi:MAG: aspartate/glutamate racemase family protein [Imperialibacter sp.]|uniref:glutamate racemase n=1 Tax=Imperialibacter sp. TaxID=2038411 RepID=UPI0032EEC9F8
MTYAVGILDYGIGGMGLVKLIQDRHPKTSLIYFSDAGAVPYGKQSKVELRKRIVQVLDFLFRQECRHVVVACHSASSVLIESDLNVTSIIPITIDTVLKSGHTNVGIVGGGRTIRSQKYKKALQSSGITVKQRIAQKLSILIEKGIISGEEIESVVRKVVAPFKEEQALLLACTHYPAILNLFKKFLPESCQVIDPIEQVLTQIFPLLNADLSTNHRFLTTGNPGLMKITSEIAFDVSTDQIELVVLD